MKTPPTIMVKGSTLSQTWAILVYATYKYGMTIQASPNYTNNPNLKISFTKDVAAVIEYKEDAINEIFNRIIHPMYGQHNGYEDYEMQFIPGTKQFKHAIDINTGFHYTYVGRLRRKSICKMEDDYRKCSGYYDWHKCDCYNDGEYMDWCCYVDQLKFIAEHLDPFNRRLQAITWDIEEDLPATIMDEDKKSVPCLQRVKVRNLGNGFYEIVLNWRSRDASKAYLFNILGLVNSIDQLIQESREKLGQPKIKLAKITEFIDSLQIYETEWDVASKVPIDCKTIENCLFI